MNSTQKPSQYFVDSLDFLLVDCRSGDPERHPGCVANTILGFTCSILLPIIIAAGLFGNTATAYIYLRKLGAHTRNAVYFSAIAISDSCCLVKKGIFWMFVAKGLPWISNGTLGFFITNVSSLFCSVMRYVEYLVELSSSALMLTMVVDRMLSVYFPLKMQQKTPKFAARLCGITVAACMIATLPIGLANRWVFGADGSILCYTPYQPAWFFTLITYYASMLFYPPTLLLIGIIICNILLAVKVREIVSRRSQLQAGSDSDKSSSSSVKNSLITIYLSTVLVVCMLPMFFSIVVEIAWSNSGNEYSQAMVTVVWAVFDLSRVLVLVNQSVNWLVLLRTSSEFRTSFLEMFGRRAA